MVRVRFGGVDLQRFRASDFSDSYVKLTFPRPGVSYPEPLDIGQIQATMPQSDWPVVRTYTVRAWDPVRHEVTIDFVVHSDHGVAGPWAAAAQPGDRIFLSGPGGAYAPDPAADWHLLIGDESALPAIAAAIERLPADAEGQVLIEVPDRGSEIELVAPSGVRIGWLHAAIEGGTPGRALVKAVTALAIPQVDVQPSCTVKRIRGRSTATAAGQRRPAAGSTVHLRYWRIGATEEGWRAAKADWNAAAEEVERRAGVA
jgi:NADPH-dependent ferric siderophore reductase